MEETVLLSDSSESVFSVNINTKTKDLKDNNEKNRWLHDSDSNDFEFPEVNFYCITDEDKDDELKNITNTNSSSDCNFSQFQQDEVNTPSTSKVLNQCEYQKPEYKTIQIHLSDSAKESDEENRNIKTQKKNKTVRKKNKNQLVEERLKRQEQLTREKALKTILTKKSKNIKPGECMKFMEVVLDKGIEKFTFFTDIINTLVDANLQYNIKTELISNSITWKRKIENNYINEANEISALSDIETINQIMIIWNWDETVTQITNGTFYSSISSIRSLLPEYNMILVIFGIEDYFLYKNQSKNSSKSAKCKTQEIYNKNIDVFKSLPKVSRRQVEAHLNEIQIVAGCSSKIVNKFQDLALIVYQYTKAIAEMPYKLQKNTNLTNKFDWYVMGDNRNTVRVDKEGNGLKRLWQQQLCQFNLSSLEIAEAICSVYPSPANLIEAYINSTADEGLNLLKDIPIRRAAGPLTAVRKVGPELSKKIYLMFISKDGESVLT